MKTIKDGYGMGLFQFPFGAKMAYGHNGGIDGFTSIVGYFPEDKLAVSYITNGQVYPINDIMIGILSIAYGTPYQIPSFKTVSISSEELDKYLGNYSAAQAPIKILIAKDKSTLMAQATGQPSFPLEAKGNHTFSFDQAGIILIFNPEKSEMTLKQGGGEFVFAREN